MTLDDRVRLQHMLHAAQEGVAFCADQDREGIRDNRVLTLALVKCIEIVGEAAAKISPKVRSEFPALPWTKIVAMRNHLIHAYFDVDWEIVFDTVHDDLPPLIAELKQILSAAGSNA